MRFYRLTYNARMKINRRINNEGDRFESIFESMPDELTDMSKGNLTAFLSDYSTKKLHIAAAVRNGEIYEYTDEINTYIPCDISKEYEIEEITCRNFDDYLDDADRINGFRSNDIRENLGTDKIFSRRWGRDLEFSERFIESGVFDCCSPDLDDEIERIEKSSNPEYACNPIHYIIGGCTQKSRNNLLSNLLRKLKENGRLSHSRYTVIHIKNLEYGSIGQMAEEADALFKLSVGGAVVFSIADKLVCDEERRSFIQDLLIALCKTGKKYAKKTLLIFLLPDNNLATASAVRKYMKDTAFVEIKESTLNATESRNYLSGLAKNDSFRANKALYKNIGKDKNYYIDELTEFYDKWYESSVISKNFPAYKKN